jgi:hypothetical protein
MFRNGTSMTMKKYQIITFAHWVVLKILVLKPRRVSLIVLVFFLSPATVIVGVGAVTVVPL